MKSHRILVSFLILTALLTGLLLLASCAEEAPKQADPAAASESVTDAAEETEPEETAEPEPEPHLPDADEYRGQTFNVLARGGGEWAVQDIYAEADSGDTITSAVYNRNLKIYDTLGVEVTENKIGVDSIASHLYNTVASGDTSYDAVDMHPMAQFECAGQDLLYDLESDVPNLELDCPWWDQGTREDFSIGGKLFYVASDTNIMAHNATWVAVYNKNLLGTMGYDEDYIYGLVRDGKWTLDAYYELTRDLVKDLNNDNIMNSKDQYGTAYQGSGPTGFLICAGFRYSDKDEEGLFSYHELDDTGLDIMNKVLKICQTSYNSHFTGQNENSGSEPENGRTMFIEGRSLFFTETLLAVDTFRDMEDNYGIVPLPKYSEETEYITYIHSWAGSTFSVPTTAPDVDKTGYLLDYMNYLSRQIVRPAYFDRVVEGKYSRDNDSYEMLTEYIMPHRVFDIVSANNYGGLPNTIMEFMNSGSPAFSSAFARSAKVLTQKLEDLNEGFAD